MGLLKRIRDYTASDDPLVGASNTVALVLAGNQPFYPLYLLGLFGTIALPALIQIVITPAFAIVPWVSRRFPLGGRVFLVLVSVGNTIIYIKIIGEAAGLQLFLVPCAMLAAFIFRQRERRLMLVLTTLSPVVYFALNGRYGGAVIPFSPADYETMRTMNTVSIATLIGFFGILFSGVLAAAEQASTRER